MSNDKAECKSATKNSIVKIAAVAVASILVTAAFVAAMGSFAAIIAYAQQYSADNSHMTTFEEEANASDDTTMSTDTSSQQTANSTSNDTRTQSDETTTASTFVEDSACAPVLTASDTGLSDSTRLASLEDDDNGSTDSSGTSSSLSNTTTAATGQNDTQSASLESLIESACDAIRDGKSVTALGFLSSAQEILNGDAGTQAASQIDLQEDDVIAEDQDEPGDIEDQDDAEDESEENDR